MMQGPFSPYPIGTIQLRNRIIRSATYYALADEDGFVGQPTLSLMKRLAAGGIGLIITGYAYVDKSGQSFNDMNGIQDDDHIPPYRQITKAVHELGAKIAMQIAHCGSLSEATARSGGDLMAVSLVEDLPDYGKRHREMTEEDILRIIGRFAEAARRVQEAGFDGVQIHGAHGYLISQFLSPITNRRKDKWGGPLENRMRFVVEVTRAVRAAVKGDFPVMIKLGCRDYVKGHAGLTIEEGVCVAQTLAQEGVSLIEVSHGIQDRHHWKKRTGITSPDKEAYLLQDAQAVRKEVDRPISLVGGLRSLQVIHRVIHSEGMDLVSMCRPFIREPHLVRRWMEGDTRPAACISCSGCFNLIDGKMHIFCRQEAQKAKGT